MLEKSQYFPPAELASPDGLVCLGGSLTPEWVLDAYRHGIFPWPIFDMDDPIAWWSPDPRAIFELQGFHISRSLRRTLRKGCFRVTCNQAFEEVIKGCATAQERPNDGTWITSAMMDAYIELHQLGHAKSIEVWFEQKVVGGLYGLAIGGLFAAESMYYAMRDASKVALVGLIAHLNTRGYQLLDIQQLTTHTSSLGAIEIPRAEYLTRAQAAVATTASFGDYLEGDLLQATKKNMASS